MAAAVERVVTLMSPGEKAELDRKVKQASRQWRRKISAAELVRAAVKAYDVDESANEQDELRSLLDLFNSMHPGTLEALDRANGAIDRSLAYFEQKRAR